MVCAPVQSIIPLLKLGDYLSVQAHKPCSISHLEIIKQQKILSHVCFIEMTVYWQINVIVDEIF